MRPPPRPQRFRFRLRAGSATGDPCHWQAQRCTQQGPTVEHGLEAFVAGGCKIPAPRHYA
eukprot:1076798-Pyramimonas_sp.AAC.1